MCLKGREKHPEGSERGKEGGGGEESAGDTHSSGTFIFLCRQGARLLKLPTAMAARLPPLRDTKKAFRGTLVIPKRCFEVNGYVVDND